MDDKKLDRLLATYRLSIDTGPLAVDATARAARIRAVRMKDGLAAQGFFGFIAALFGLRRASAAMWSACAGMVFAALIGISFGASGGLTSLDETAFSIDFDSVMGSGTVAAPLQGDQDL